MSNQTYIIGHKNPDADAICSAIAYQAYKHALGETHCFAARCGNSNERIDTILQRFNQPLPLFVGDVTPRLQDIMSEKLYVSHPDMTVAEDLEIMDRHDIPSLPVVNSEKKLLGSVSIFDLGEYFIPKPKASKEMRHVRTSIYHIVRALKAKPVHLHNPDHTEDLYVRIGAMDIRTFGTFRNQEQISESQSIIVVGDRYDIQSRSINSKVRLLVITGHLQVDEDIIKMAKDNDVCLIISPYDSATTSWIIRSANLTCELYAPKAITFKPEETVKSVKRKIAANVAPSYMVVNEEEQLLGIFSKGDIIKPSQKNLILVDHNEISQAVTGAQEVNIVEIIDHHRLGNIPTQQPILFKNIPWGSTCTIIADMFCSNKVPLSSDIAGILMSGIISDTLNLNSPTSTLKDKEMLDWLSPQAKISNDELSKLIFSSGSVILNQDPETVIRSDMKTYEHRDIRYSVSQVEELGYNNFWQHQTQLEEALEQVRHAENLNWSAILITDINRQNSLLLVSGDESISTQISYPQVEREDIFELQGIVSRKKQLIPYLSSLLSSMEL